MSDFVTKFIKDQEAAVQIARDVSDTPNDYNIRVDAINAALSINANTSQDWTTADVIKSAKEVEKYLRNDKKGK